MRTRRSFSKLFDPWVALGLREGSDARGGLVLRPTRTEKVRYTTGPDVLAPAKNSEVEEVVSSEEGLNNLKEH